jgi:hypothetical protein
LDNLKPEELIFMSRGTQKSDEERLQILDDQVAELESKKNAIDEKIKGLGEQKQVILDQQQQKKLKEIQRFISKSGKTPKKFLKF